MLEWYNKKDIGVFFNNVPNIKIRYSGPNTPEVEKDVIKKFPFINEDELEVEVFYHKKNKSYEFIIPKGYCFDGASIPRIFWRIIGPNTDNTFLVAAMVHDYLCENHSVIDNDRYLSTLIFNDLLEVGGVCKIKRWFMKHSVDNYQKFCGWKKGDRKSV
ncbi:DUF1353 domain-containing protein [bacterium]|nr:DUF1353 domain-containing protein [bacterium]